MICSLLACFQDRFINKLQVIVRKRQSVELIVDEGFYSEQEMKDDLGWTQTSPQISVHFIYMQFLNNTGCLLNFLGKPCWPRKRIDGAKARCEALGEAFCRPFILTSLKIIELNFDEDSTYL